MAGLSAANLWQWLTKQLYPNGRAFRIPDTGVLAKLHTAINLTMAQTQSDAYSILLSMIPDNSTFSYQDAIDWYRRLGLYNGFTDSSHLALMEQAILQKMSWPLAPLNMQSPAFIQQQLQAAGFPVYIYPNKFTVSAAITGATVYSAGTNSYRVGDAFRVSGGTTTAVGNVTSIIPGTGSGFSIQVNAVNSSGGIIAYNIVGEGLGYSAGDLCLINGTTGTPCVFEIFSTGPGGSVGTIGPIQYGTGYTVGSTILTTNAAVFGSVLGFNFITPGDGYSTGTNIATTAASGYGTGLTINITSVSGTVVTTLTPTQVLGAGGSSGDLSAFDLGTENLGAFWNGEIIANYLEPASDATFGFTSNLDSTFYISGGSSISSIATYATIPAVRQTEFRQLVLKLKRCETVGFAFVTYD